MPLGVPEVLDELHRGPTRREGRSARLSLVETHDDFKGHGRAVRRGMRAEAPSAAARRQARRRPSRSSNRASVRMTWRRLRHAVRILQKPFRRKVRAVVEYRPLGIGWGACRAILVSRPPQYASQRSTAAEARPPRTRGTKATQRCARLFVRGIARAVAAVHRQRARDALSVPDSCTPSGWPWPTYCVTSEESVFALRGDPVIRRLLGRADPHSTFVYPTVHGTRPRPRTPGRRAAVATPAAPGDSSSCDVLPSSRGRLQQQARSDGIDPGAGATHYRATGPPRLCAGGSCLCCGKTIPVFKAPFRRAARRTGRTRR